MTERAIDSKPLDEILLAMDVVDTLRHREKTLVRELDEAGRRDELIARLKEIYRAQGIEVSDAVIAEGVQALKEQRFAYTPPKPSLSVRLAKLYVSRDRWSKPVLGTVIALGLAATVYQVGIAGPAASRAEAVRVELTQTLPAEITALEDEIGRIAIQDRAIKVGATYATEARAALRSEDRDAARRAVQSLKALRDELATAYEIRVVYGPNEARSGVIRLNDNVPGNTLYYLIVEAIDPAGRPVERLITNQEDTLTKRTSKWGQEVSEADFNRVAADKRDDLIIQDAVIGTKAIGALDPDFTIDTTGGAILEW